MKPQDIHSMALFWCAVGIAIGALATRYIPTTYVIIAGIGIVALILTHHLSTWMKKQHKAAHAFTATQNTGKRKRTSSKKHLPKMKGA